MNDVGTIGLLLIITNVLISYQGLKNNSFFDRYKFDVDRVLLDKDYKRIITSGFLHVDWIHLIFNMLSLYAFSDLLEYEIGEIYFLTIYFSSLVGGNLLSLFIHRNHGDYSAVGASGAVCGVIFASIALFPGLGIGFFGIPLSIPSWLYGILFVLYSIYGIKNNSDNIGHEAHIGGALVGLLTALIIKPNAIYDNPLPIILIVIPSCTFVYIVFKHPHHLLTNKNFFTRKKTYLSVEQRYNEQKMNRQKELDNLLDKISKKGFNSLSKEEKEKLENLSR